MAPTPSATGWKLAIAALGAALLGAAAFDLWRVLWQDELWRLPRGGVLATLGGALIGIALQWAQQSANAALVAGSAAVCVGGAVLAQSILGLDAATAIESRVLRAKKLAKAEREMQSLAVRPIDLRPRQQILDSLRQAGIEAWPTPVVFTLGNAVDAGLIQLQPLSGISNAWVVYCNEGDLPHVPIDRTDRHGFNNADTVYAMSGDRIALLGDSYAWGACVHQEQTIAGHLRRQGFAAISLGVGGNGPLSNLAILREFGATVAPQTVVWLHTDGNDIDDLRGLELRSAAFRRYADPQFRQGLASRQAEVDAVWKRIYADGAARYQAGQALHQRGHPLHAAAPTPTPEEIDRFARAFGVEGLRGLGDDDMIRLAVGIIAAAREEARRLGARFLFVPIRAAPTYRSTYREKHLDRVLADVRRAGIEIVDPDPAIRASGDPDQFFPETHENPHYNARGYSMLADLVRGALAKPDGIRVVEATLGKSCLGVALPLPMVNNVRIGNLTRTLVARCAGERECTLPLAEHGFVGTLAPGCPYDIEAIWRCLGERELRRFYVAPGMITAETVIRLACP